MIFFVRDLRRGRRVFALGSVMVDGRGTEFGAVWQTWETLEKNLRSDIKLAEQQVAATN